MGEDDDARLALGGPHGDLSLIRRHLLTLSKAAINTVHIWLTDPSTPILAHTTDSYDRLPSTLRQLLLHSNDKLVFTRKPVPRGTESINLLMKNLQNHRAPNTLTFVENTIIWYRSLLLNRAHADDMTGFDNGILIIAYIMCSPVELMQYYQMDPTTQPPQKSGEMTCSKSCTQQLQIGTVTTMMIRLVLILAGALFYATVTFVFLFFL